MQKDLTNTQAGAYLHARTSVPLGPLYESEQRVKCVRALKKYGISPYPIATRAIVSSDRALVWEQMIKNGFGATKAAAMIIESPEFETGPAGSMAFGWQTLRSLGFSEPPTWAELWSWSLNRGPVCPISAAPALLKSFKSGEVGDGCRLLTKPVLVDGNWHYLYVSGNGPTLYAFPFIPGTRFSLDMEIMFRIAP